MNDVTIHYAGPVVSKSGLFIDKTFVCIDCNELINTTQPRKREKTPRGYIRFKRCVNTTPKSITTRYSIYSIPRRSNPIANAPITWRT